MIICLDPPQWALVMWRAVKILFPPRMVEKVDLLSTKDRALKPRLQRYMDVRDMEPDSVVAAARVRSGASFPAVLMS